MQRAQYEETAATWDKNAETEHGHAQVMGK